MSSLILLHRQILARNDMPMYKSFKLNIFQKRSASQIKPWRSKIFPWIIHLLFSLISLKYLKEIHMHSIKKLGKA